MTPKLLPKGTPFVKRLFDILLASLALILLSPVILIVSILVAAQLGFPILFRQDRPGYLGEIFTIYKFRTMREGKDSQGNTLPDSQRLTRSGAFPAFHQPGRTTGTLQCPEG